MTNRDIAVVVVAAGRGERLGAGKPKAFVDLVGKPLLSHAIESISALPDLAQLCQSQCAGRKLDTLAHLSVLFFLLDHGQCQPEILGCLNRQLVAGIRMTHHTTGAIVNQEIR